MLHLCYNQPAAVAVHAEVIRDRVAHVEDVHTMSQLQQLYRLQQIDNEIREKKQRLREVMRALKDDEEVVAARKHKERTEEALQKMQGRQKELELQLGSVNDEAQRSEDRLYSGEVTNPKELSDLQQKIASLGRRKESLEDQILETMLAVEEAQEVDEAAGERLREAEAEWEARRERLEQEQDALAEEAGRLLQQREAQADRISDEMLATYEETARRRGGVAVAALVQQVCQACTVRVSATKARAAKTGELVYCSSCGRILYPPY
ncbi:MAG: hypothetical protein R3248_09665 [Candidatus Promineifilaceae bacterium]|nr:hypothetical protein [Candidatus Promineifilaceae bacterium]